MLNSQARTITQTISFGKVSNYQFIDSINAAIQNQAKNIIAANLLSITANGVNPQNIWNTPIPVPVPGGGWNIPKIPV